MSTQALTDLSRTNDSPLLRLPQELLIRVASYLTTPELGHLRTTCKDVESKLFESFAYEFFHKRQFMIEEPSLQALLDISKHPTLSKRLTEVVISTTQYGQAENLGTATAQRLLLGEFTNSRVLESSGQARDMLVEAFNNLPSLKKVGLRDYDAKGRYRDGDEATWKSYGHAIMAGDNAQAGSLDRIWALLLHATARSDANVPSIEVFLRHSNLSDSSFDVLSRRMSEFIIPTLGRVRTLMLTLDAHQRFPSDPFRHLRLKKFLHHTPALERLRLNFDGGSSDFLDWLALGQGGSGAVGSPTHHALDDYTIPVAFQHLTTLDLGIVAVEPSTLLKILTRFELKSFNLWRIMLRVEAGSDIESDLSAVAKFIDKLATAPATKRVQSAMLGYIKVNRKDDSRHHAKSVNFPPASSAADKKATSSAAEKKSGSSPPQKSKHQVVNFRHGDSAHNFAAWAKEMAGRAVLVKEWQRLIPESDPEEEDEDDQDDDGEDEDEEGESEEDEEDEDEEDD